LVEAPVPDVADKSILLRVHAAALQRSDLEAIAVPNSPAAMEYFGVSKEEDFTGVILGSEAAGEVVEVGKDVTALKLRDKVCSLYFYDYVDGPLSAERILQGRGDFMDGVFGDYVLVEETGVAPIPSALSFEEACTLGAGGLTAWMATIGNSLVKAGDVVVVQGTGGVSTFALQFAVAAGAHVIVLSSSEEKLDVARGLGAEHGVNYKEHPDWAEEVLRLTDGGGADVVIDMGGKGSAAKSIDALKFYGTLVLVGALESYDESVPSVPVLEKNIRVRGVYIGSRADYYRMAAFVDEHDIHPVVAGTYPLERYLDAIEELRVGNVVGRIVFQLD
jgi:NADPH:quinone reductase-like Zn-dependent oxidoreductase